MKTNNWSLQTKFLHIGLVLTVSAQLLISLVMTAPDDTGNAVSRAAFEMHEIVGLTALVIVLLHWGWTVFSQADGGLEHLFPVSKQARQELIDDVNWIGTWIGVIGSNRNCDNRWRIVYFISRNRRARHIGRGFCRSS